MPAAPDLDVSRPTAEEVASAAALAAALDKLGRGVEASSTHFGSIATGEALESALGDLAGTRDSADDGATSAVAAAQSMRGMRAGGDAWLRDAPKQADLERAEQKVASIRAEMQLAALSGLPASLIQERLAAAQNELRELESRREAADAAYERACRRAAAKLGPQGKCQPGDRRGPRGGDAEEYGDTDWRPDTEANNLDTPAPAPSAPGAPAPVHGTGTPAASAPPATRTASAPPMTAPSTSSSPGLNADALKLLASQPQNPQQPQMPAAAPQPAPQLAAQSGAPTAAGPAQNAKTSGALTADDFGDTIAPAPVGLGLAGGGAPAATVSPSAPAPAAAAAAAAAPVPQTTGTSANNLSTAADTSGRSEPARTAYNPTTTTSHATGSAAAPATPLAGRGMGTGTAMPHMPMVPMGGMPGGGAGGAGGSRGGDGSKVTAYDSGRDHGASSINESVRGGTIAQRRELD